MEFVVDCHDPVWMDCNTLVDPFPFHLVPSSSNGTRLSGHIHLQNHQHSALAVLLWLVL